MDPRDLLLLTDKVAIVTAAGAGIGKGTALLLASVGAKVAALDIDRPHCATGFEGHLHLITREPAGSE